MKSARKKAIVILFALSVIVIFSIIIAFFALTEGAKLDKDKLPGSHGDMLYDRNGNEIVRSNYVRINEISPYIRNAFLAVEDKRFYRHNGVDLVRSIGALFANIKSGKRSQGGSTITCQLVKNTHLSPEKTIKRKLSEMKIALKVEKYYTKDEILEMYLNVIYFGKGIYGVKNACKALYGKSPSNVTPAEAASLAATIANPSQYSILLHPDNNATRTDMILSLMRSQKFITDAEYGADHTVKIIMNYSKFNNNYNDIYIKSALSEANNLHLTAAKRPFKIYTYYDEKSQKEAETALSAYSLSSSIDASTELMIADNATGGIVAYASTKKEAICRQPGSLLKPFLYATAIERGKIIPDSPLLDQLTDFNGYRPANYKNKYYGWVDARFALANSLNTVSVSILREIGIDDAVRDMQKCGIRLEKNDRNLALALGGTTRGSTINEMCDGYLTLANRGMHRESRFIEKITDRDGNVLYVSPNKGESVYSAETAYLVTDMLSESARVGTAKQLSYLRFPVAAKTGTVDGKNGNTDAWCAAYTTNHTVVCRYSSTHRKFPMPDTVTGGNQPTKCIRATLQNLYEEKPSDFSRPLGLKSISIDRTIKDELHLLIPSSFESNQNEVITISANFVLDSPDPERLFLNQMQITKSGKYHLLSFNALKCIDYEVYLNEKPCEKVAEGVYAIKRTLFPLAKLEILCKRMDRALYKKSKIVRLD